jgi:hypothetical protein
MPRRFDEPAVFCHNLTVPHPRPVVLLALDRERVHRPWPTRREPLTWIDIDVDERH